MSKINLSDFVKMATSGWTPQAFNAALDRLEQFEQPEQPEQPKQQEQLEQQDQQGQQEQPEQQGQQDQQEVDSRDAKIIELEEKIASMQKNNVNHDMSNANHKSDTDIIDDMLRNFL